MQYLEIEKINDFIAEMLKEFQEHFPETLNDMSETKHTLSEYYVNTHHLENDVWSHTLLVLSNIQKIIEDIDIYFIPRYFNINKINIRAIIIAALLHDLGKYYSREEDNVKNKVYFTNHANYSVFYGIDIINHFVKKGFIDTEDVAEVIFLINKHYDLYNMPKEDIAKKFYKFGFNWFVDLFILVLADNKGRFAISNNRVSDIENLSLTKIDKDFNYNIDVDYCKQSLDLPTITFMVGIPYSGKTTYIEKYKTNETVLSRDDIIQELMPNMSYNDAFKSVDHKQVDTIFSARFNKAVRNKENIIIDMCNTSKKARNKYISGNSNVLKHYYKIAKVMFIGQDTFLDRYYDRIFKQIKPEIMDNFINKMSIPYYDEFDKIELYLDGKLIAD